MFASLLDDFSSSLRFQGFTKFKSRVNTSSSSCRVIGKKTIFVSFSWLFSTKKPTLEEEIMDLMVSSSDLVKQRKFNDADNVLHQILLMLSNAATTGFLSHQEFIGRRAHVFSQMAELRLLQKDYIIAEQLFVQVIRDCTEAGVSISDPMIIELSLKLAMIFSVTGDFLKAVNRFEFCLMMQKSNVSVFMDEISCENLSTEQINGIALLGMIYNVYAHFLILNNQLEVGKNLLESALKAARRIYQTEHQNCLNLLSDLVNVDSQLDQCNEARLHLQEGIDLAKLSISKIPPNEPAELSPVFNILLSFYLQLTVLENSLGCFAEAQMILDTAGVLFSEIQKSNLDTDISSEKLKEVQNMIDSLSFKSTSKQV